MASDSETGQIVTGQVTTMPSNFLITKKHWLAWVSKPTYYGNYNTLQVGNKYNVHHAYTSVTHLFTVDWTMTSVKIQSRLPILCPVNKKQVKTLSIIAVPPTASILYQVTIDTDKFSLNKH